MHGVLNYSFLSPSAGSGFSRLPLLRPPHEYLLAAAEAHEPSSLIFSHCNLLSRNWMLDYDLAVIYLLGNAVICAGAAQSITL